MKEPVVNVFLGNDYQFSTIAIKSLKVSASIFSSYPRAEVVLDDPEGKYLSALVAKPGNTVSIFAGPSSEVNTTNIPPTYFCSFKVLGISNKGVFTSINDAAQVGSLGGDYTIHLCHPWISQTDRSNHAYRAKTSEIVKTLVSNTSRGFEFTGIKIDATDDAGKIIRYKIGESEAKFIHQKLLPYTTIDKQAGYSFVDELGVFHLHNFKKMYNQDSKVVITPPFTDAIGTTYTDSSTLPQYPLYDGGWWVGNKFTEQLGVFKKKIYVEDSSTQISFVATLPYSSAIPGYTLMDKEYIDNVASTDVSIYPFRNFEDAVRLDTNNNGVMNEFFSVSVTIDFAPDLAVVGQPVTLALADGNDPTKTHWMNGKWLVATSEHFLRDGRYFSKYLLCRPALDYLPEGVDSEILYKSK